MAVPRREATIAWEPALAVTSPRLLLLAATVDLDFTDEFDSNGCSGEVDVTRIEEDPP